MRTTLLGILLALGLCLSARGQYAASSFPLLTGTTNATGTAIFVEGNLYHTAHIVATGGTTNVATVVLRRSLDGTNWVNFATNAIAGGSVAEVTATGCWSYISATLTTTNSLLSVAVNYLGGK
ncbi:MAG TPA: hypothetical protein VMU04_14140 [Candidatus Acidoferrum sp.]|nr:hypothetical protein [Candidatus Acidoferrum sp.]